MRKIKNAIKHYIKESIDSLLVDQLASFLFGIIVTWFIRNNILEINDEAISIGIKFLILFTVFLVVYTISTILQLRPDRYKFRMKSVNILVEYLGDTIRMNSKYTFSTNRIKSNRMYTRRDWFSDETFKIRCLTKGYKTKKISSLGNTHEYYIIFS